MLPPNVENHRITFVIHQDPEVIPNDAKTECMKRLNDRSFFNSRLKKALLNVFSKGLSDHSIEGNDEDVSASQVHTVGMHQTLDPSN